MKRFGSITLAVLWFTATSSAMALEGPARVIDGDTVIVSGVTVRLKGVDAPEQATVYGPAATHALRAVSGAWLTCELTGEKTRGREVGYCRNASGQDIGLAIVASGLALSCPRYSTRYLAYERPDAVQRLGRSSYCVRPRRW